MCPRPVCVVVDSTADLPASLREAAGIRLMPTAVTFGERTYLHGVDLDNQTFYRLLSESPVFPTTAAAGPGVIEDVFTPILDEGYDIVSVHLSGVMSAVVAITQSVADSISRDRIRIVDSLQVSVGLGLLALRCAEMARSGLDMESVCRQGRELVPRLRLAAVLQTLEYVRKGGRISNTTALVGTLLNIRLVFEMRKGKVEVIRHVRSTPRAREKLIETVRSWGPVQNMAMVHVNEPATLDVLAGELAGDFPMANVLRAEAGPTIASHAGPGAFGVAAVLA
jgi:DegV family protein with EDD domain